jgi:hypothetical protein
LLGKLKKKFKKKVKTDLPYLSFYKKKPETHIFFFGLNIYIESVITCSVYRATSQPGLLPPQRRVEVKTLACEVVCRAACNDLHHFGVVATPRNLDCNHESSK